MQRLKKIHQYGTFEFIKNNPIPYDRFTHSLGVYYLLKRHGAPYKEQIAGLLHDISHTAFSHSTDALYMGDMVSGAYQDHIHVQFLQKHGIEKILMKYGYSAHEFDILHNHFPALKQKHPNLCADRIEYIIYAGYKEGFLRKDQIKNINRDLDYKNGTWYFTTLESAKQFAQISLHETLHRWGGPHALYINLKSCELFKAALSDGVITTEDLLFDKTDDAIWNLFIESKNPIIKKHINDLKNHDSLLHDLPNNCIQRYYSKFRGVDPLVRTNTGSLARLSTLDQEFATTLQDTIRQTQNGWCLPL